MICMRKLYKYNERATVCANKNCVTVYGETARIVNTLVVAAVLLVALAYVAKALR